MKIEFLELDRTSKYKSEVIEMIYKWYKTINNISKEQIEYFINHSANDKGIPKTIVAILNNEVVGCYQILMCDLSSRPDLYPWLGNVCIREDLRGQGIGREMINHVPVEMKKLGIKKLYLHSQIQGMYEKFGCKFIEEAPSWKPNEKDKRIFVLEI